jgi:hypothetical protein
MSDEDADEGTASAAATPGVTTTMTTVEQKIYQCEHDGETKPAASRIVRTEQRLLSETDVTQKDSSSSHADQGDHRNEEHHHRHDSLGVHHSLSSASPPSTVSTLDPREVLRASIAFEKSNHQLYQSKSVRQMMTIDTTGSRQSSASSLRCSLSSTTRTASSSNNNSFARLYPSIESLSLGEDRKPSSSYDGAGAADLFEVDVEQTWASASSSRAREKAATNTKPVPIASPEMPSTTGSNNNCYYESCQYQSSSSASGHAAAAATASAGYACSSRSIQEDERMFDYAFIPSERDVAAASACATGDDDDDLIALKRAAYGLGQTEAATVETISRRSDSAARTSDVEATVLDYSDFAHPSEHAVQAEFMFEGEDYQHENIADGNNNDDDRFLLQSSGYVTASQDADLPVEATVISSGPTDKATTSAWSSDAAEAFVLQSDATSEEGNLVDDLDTKPPAQNYDTLPDNVTGVDQYQTSSMAIDTMVDAELCRAVATVVDYDIHPSQMTPESVQAEFLGRSDANMTIPDGNNALSNFRTEHYAFEIDQSVERLRDGGAHVTVVDSGPIQNAEVLIGQSVVQNGDDDGQNLIENDAKMDFALSHHSSEPGGDGDGNIAEVIDITEEVHPAELETNHAPTAEFVGIGSNVALAIRSDATTLAVHHMIGTEQTDIMVDNGSRAPDVYLTEDAVAVATRECIAEVVLADQAASLAGIPDASLHTETIESATPVAVMTVEEDFDHQAVDATNDFYNYPVKPDLIYHSSTGPLIAAPHDQTARAISEPLNAASAITTDTEPEWTRAPSFGGTENDSPEPLVPPVATEESNLLPGAIPPAIPVPQHAEVTVSTISQTSDMSQKSDSRSDSFGAGVNAVRPIRTNLWNTGSFMIQP